MFDLDVEGLLYVVTMFVFMGFGSFRLWLDFGRPVEQLLYEVDEDVSLVFFHLFRISDKYIWHPNGANG